MQISAVLLFHPECASCLDSHIPVLERESGRAWGIPIHSLTKPIVVDWIMVRQSWHLRNVALGGKPLARPSGDEVEGTLEFSGLPG